MIKWLLIAVGAAASLYIAIVIALFVKQRSLIYPAPKYVDQTVPAGYSPIQLHTSDGLTLGAIYAEGLSGRHVFVFFHGNGADVESGAVATNLLRKAGYGVLVPEYRGYGGNPGSPSEAGLYQDGTAALDWLVRHGVASDRIVLIGNSLGSGVATQLAMEHNVGGVVLVSPFTSMADAIAPHYWFVPVRLLLRDRFENLRKLRERTVRLLVLHGDRDTLVSDQQGSRLAQAIPGTRLVIVPGAGHELAYLPIAQHQIIAWLNQFPR